MKDCDHDHEEYRGTNAIGQSVFGCVRCGKSRSEGARPSEIGLRGSPLRSRPARTSH